MTSRLFHWQRIFLTCGLLPGLMAARVSACELCAIYGADSSQKAANSGFSFTLSEQYISATTLQALGKPFDTVPFLNEAYVDSSYTHLVPSYNFNSRLGLSLNVPIIHRDFHLTEFLTTGQTVDERGSLTGLGDISVIARAGLLQKIDMKYSAIVNVLVGAKLPTGDPQRLEAEVDAAKVDLALFGPNHPHGAIGGVHEHDLTLGSGSYDGIFGITSAFRWDRWFLNSQAQYDLRTEALGYQYGDETIVSGGPGAYVLLSDNYTLSVQANAFFEYDEEDRILGQLFDQTGMTAWYIGPLINFTIGSRLSVNVGAELPLSINNHGLQTVPDYRVHGGFTWRF